MNILYLTTAYPHVSHTFIRREILALEMLGRTVHRVSIRPGSFVDSADQQEAEKTIHLLTQKKSALIAGVIKGVICSWTRLPAAIKETITLSKASERGFLRHLAYLFEALVLRDLANEREVGHIHVHFGTNAAAVAYLCRILGGPEFSMTIHGPDEFDAPLGLSLGKKVRAARFTVAISDFCKAQIQRWVGYEHWNRIHVVRCGVGEEWFTAETEVSEDARNIVCVGRLSEQKGHLQLLEAFEIAVGEGLQLDLVFVGDGALRPMIEKRIKESGLEDRVTIAGWSDADQVRQQIEAARCLVLPSFAEGLPVVLMEAMAMGRPVVATSIMGTPELVRPAQEGWLVIAGNSRSLSAAMLELEASPIERLRAMGQSGSNRVKQRHSARTEAQKLAELFDRYAEVTCTRSKPIDAEAV